MAAPMTPSDRAFVWTIGDRVRKAREASGNQNARKFYESLGLNRDRMSRVERGIEQPRLADLAAVSWATGFSVELIRGDEDPTPPTGGLIRTESSSACTSLPLADVVPLRSIAA